MKQDSLTSLTQIPIDSGRKKENADQDQGVVTSKPEIFRIPFFIANFPSFTDLVLILQQRARLTCIAANHSPIDTEFKNRIVGISPFGGRLSVYLNDCCRRRFGTTVQPVQFQRQRSNSEHHTQNVHSFHHHRYPVLLSFAYRPFVFTCPFHC